MSRIMAQLRKYIDIGANLTDLMYTGVYNGSKKHDEDLHNVLQRSWNSGIERIIITAGNFEESEKALKLARTDERLYSTVGCHPTRCLEFENGNSPEEYLEKLKSLIDADKNMIVAIGECGLDYDRIQFCPKDIQKKYFEMQLKLTEHSKLPLFLHCRNAANDLTEILKKYEGLTGVVHSFDGTTKEANDFINLGYYIGINGCSLKTSENLQTVAELPVDKILMETDCPWCEIRPSHAGYKLISKDNQFEAAKKEKWRPDVMVKSRNEPCTIGQVLDVIAAVKEEDPNELSQIIYKNTIDLFFGNK